MHDRGRSYKPRKNFILIAFGGKPYSRHSIRRGKTPNHTSTMIHIVLKVFYKVHSDPFSGTSNKVKCKVCLWYENSLNLKFVLVMY